MLYLFDHLWLDKIIPKNNDRTKKAEPYNGNLENKIKPLYWLVENSIHKNNMQTIEKSAVTEPMQTEKCKWGSASLFRAFNIVQVHQYFTIYKAVLCIKISTFSWISYTILFIIRRYQIPFYKWTKVSHTNPYWKACLLFIF